MLLPIFASLHLGPPPLPTFKSTLPPAKLTVPRLTVAMAFIQSWCKFRTAANTFDQISQSIRPLTSAVNRFHTQLDISSNAPIDRFRSSPSQSLIKSIRQRIEIHQSIGALSITELSISESINELLDDSFGHSLGQNSQRSTSLVGPDRFTRSLGRSLECWRKKSGSEARNPRRKRGSQPASGSQPVAQQRNGIVFFFYSRGNFQLSIITTVHCIYHDTLFKKYRHYVTTEMKFRGRC